MKRLLTVCLIASSLLLSTGCWHFWTRKNPKPVETSAVAADVENEFKQRFIEKRTAELVAQGQRVDIARQQALDEFRARYSYTRAADK